MENEGRSNYTIKNTSKALGFLNKHTNLNNPGDVKAFIATRNTYHKTKDILFTKQQMRHSNIRSTHIYTQLPNLNDDEWTCKVAHNVEDDKQLIEAGFEYVTERDGFKIYRKRK